MCATYCLPDRPGHTANVQALVLRTARLVLTPLCLLDEAEYAQAFGNADDAPRATSSAELQWRQHGFGPWAIRRDRPTEFRSQLRYAGEGIDGIAPTEVEAGWWVTESRRNDGIAAEAMGAAIADVWDRARGRERDRLHRGGAVTRGGRLGGAEHETRAHRRRGGRPQHCRVTRNAQAAAARPSSRCAASELPTPQRSRQRPASIRSALRHHPGAVAKCRYPSTQGRRAFERTEQRGQTFKTDRGRRLASRDLADGRRDRCNARRVRYGATTDPPERRCSDRW